ncbi:MAG: phenylacetate--CoA ligase family protein [Anaerolineales bacterium]|nr:phenylacetate--CoA ligase family protein [Anaerolineales bacterium]
MLLSRFYWNLYLIYHGRGQSRYPFKRLADIQRDRDRRVRAMVAHAYRTVPYYRDTMDSLGLKPSDIRTVDDLNRLPLIDRSTVRRNPERFVSANEPHDRYLKIATGGTSGIPCSIFHDKRSIFQNSAHGERERSIMADLVGKRMGYREAVIGSTFSTAQKIHQFTRELGFFPVGINIERRFLSISSSLEENIQILNDFRPDIIQSFGSYLQVLFPHLLETGLPFHKPRVVAFSSDGLSNSVRRLIEEQFHIPVLSTYQAGEAFKIGFECREHQGYHVNEDIYPLRIVDEGGNTLPPGETGDVVISNLVNRGTVLLNYRIGDVAQLQPAPCSCGRSLPLLSFIQGRTDDWINLESGVKIHPVRIRLIFTNLDMVWQYQVIQRSAQHLDVSIVAANGYDHHEIQNRIKASFAEICGKDIMVDIRFVAEIERTNGGKVRAIVSM